MFLSEGHHRCDSRLAHVVNCFSEVCEKAATVTKQDDSAREHEQTHEIDKERKNACVEK
jgi:hypothetical protein